MNAAPVTLSDYRIATDRPSRSFRLRINDQPISVVETPPMDAAERQWLADNYRRLPDYCHIYDVAGMHLHFAHLAAVGPTTVRIEVDEDILIFRVHPLRKRIAARTVGRALVLEIPAGRSRHFIVRINALPPLMLAIEAPDRNQPATGDPAVINASSFFIDARGGADQTENFHRAFAAANGTGRTLLVPAGTYSVSQLHLKAGRNFRLHLSPGCLLKVRPSPDGANDHRHGLWLEDCEDVAVTGAGCIDHQAYEHYVLGRNQYQHGMVDYYTANDLCPWITQSPLFITGSRRITVDGLVIRNGRNFNVNCRNSEDLTLRRLKVFTPPACTPEYADGINTGSCRNVLIEDCLVACNDDCFASGHYLSTYDHRTASNHVVRRMLGWNLRASGARLGFHADHDQGDFVFEDCDFVGMIYTTFLIHPLKPRPDGRLARYGAISICECAFDDAPLLSSLLDLQQPAIAKLEIRNFIFYGEPRKTAAFVVKAPPSEPLFPITLENLEINGRRWTAAEFQTHIGSQTKGEST